MATTYNNFTDNTPDISLNVGNTFGIDADFEVPAFAEANEYVPEIDSTYCFDKNTTLAILAGFSDNRRVMIQGLHGSGKSTHIEHRTYLYLFLHMYILIQYFHYHLLD